MPEEKTSRHPSPPTKPATAASASKAKKATPPQKPKQETPVAAAPGKARQPRVKIPTARRDVRPQTSALVTANAGTPVDEVAVKPAESPKSKIAKETVKTKKIKKAQREKVVRDSFTMPREDYALIDTLKTFCLSNGFSVKKSELLRAGLQALMQLPEKKRLEAIRAVERIRTGRPG